MPAGKKSWVYILANRGCGVLYVGVTTDLRTGVWQHKNGTFEGFTKEYAVKRLVYFEEFSEVRKAIDRERALKG